jgi:hypothetical protein
MNTKQTVFGAHPASCKTGARGPFPKVKQPKHVANYKPPSILQVRNVFIYTSTPKYTPENMRKIGLSAEDTRQE